MPLPPITALPTAPSRGQDSDTFNANADAFIGALPTFRTELNAFGQAVVDATIAASAAANYSASSTSSLSLGLGSRTFAIQTGKLFVVGQFVLAASAADPTKWVHGQVTAHNSTTGALSVSVTTFNGTGTVNDWSVGLSGPMSPTGWQTIGTVATTTGTSADFLNIPQTYTDLMIVFVGVSHNSAGSANLNLSLSVDGTTFLSGTVVGAGTQIGASGTWYGGVTIPGYREAGGVRNEAVESITTNGTSAAPSTVTTAAKAWRCDAGIKGIRIGLTAGSFDAGSITLKGR